MPPTEPWTIGRLLQWTTDYLKDHGADSPRLDAEVLLAEAKHCKRIELYTAFGDEASEELRTSFRELVRRRAAGTPVAYLVGHKEFYSLDFRVTPDVLIPRPETEQLVLALLDEIKASGRPVDALQVADVGTGSGAIAICAARLAGCRVTAIDLCPQALAVAKENATRLGVAEKIEFVESDLFAAIGPDRRFDYIASNPPYVSAAELLTLAPEVRDHEPRLALAAGEQGLAVIERLIPQAGERLNPGGSLLMEIGASHEQQARELFAADPHWQLAPTLKDLAGLPRVLRAKRA